MKKTLQTLALISVIGLSLVSCSKEEKGRAFSYYHPGLSLDNTFQENHIPRDVGEKIPYNGKFLHVVPFGRKSSLDTSFFVVMGYSHDVNRAYAENERESWQIRYSTIDEEISPEEREEVLKFIREEYKDIGEDKIFFVADFEDKN